MQYAETPCSYQPCDKPEPIELDEVLIEIGNHHYETIIPSVSQSKPLFIDRQILKFKKLVVGTGGQIEFDLDNEFDFYAFVIDELEIKYADKTKPIKFTWSNTNIQSLYKKLAGTDNTQTARKPIGKGAHGLPGGTGGKGQTRHSPTVFLFIDKFVLTSSTLEDVSFDFSLKGIAGGWGGTGGNGSDGNPGKRGKHGRQGNIIRACKKGKNGGRGGQPGKGGRGGDGGCGGNGPALTILIDNEDTWNVLQRSKFDVSGADPVFARGGENAPGWGGKPGDAGREGIGGKGGKRAGKCDGGKRGQSGLPTFGSNEWRDWNLGYGLPGTAGLDGSYDFSELDNVTRIVFNDPSVSTIEE